MFPRTSHTSTAASEHGVLFGGNGYFSPGNFSLRCATISQLIAFIYVIQPILPNSLLIAGNPFHPLLVCERCELCLTCKQRARTYNELVKYPPASWGVSSGGFYEINFCSGFVFGIQSPANRSVSTADPSQGGSARTQKSLPKASNTSSRGSMSNGDC